ncbi:1,4-dihydroxy-2-naphthoate octaprenyltransferase [Candidatus Poribacteria bacterium]
MTLKRQLLVWLGALRVKFFTATLVPILLGSVVAWHGTGGFNWGYFLLALLGGILIDAGLNLGNDYSDHTSGVDEMNIHHNPFSGGSRAIQDGLLSPAQILWASRICFSLGAAIGLYLDFVLPGHTLLIIGIVGVFLAYFYSAAPVRIGYTGLGELACGLGFGPVMVLGSYYVQTGRLAWQPLWASLPVGILIALVLYINEFPDYEADKRGNKRTLVVIMGKKKAMRLYPVLLLLSYALIIAGVAGRMLPPFALISFLTVPFAFRAIKVARKNFNKIIELLPANAATITIHLALGLLLSVGYLLDKVIG